MILCAAYVQPMYAMIYDFLCMMNFDLTANEMSDCKILSKCTK